MDVIDVRSFLPTVYQATIFTPDMDFATAKVMSKFYPRCADTFDGDPEGVPNMPAFPPEVPRLILKNQEDTIKLEVAAARVNYFERLKKHDDPTINIERFYENAAGILSLFKDILDCRIGRLAAVRTLYAKQDDPGMFLARHFCKDTWDEAPLNRPENFELHAHKVYQLPEKFTVNSWVRSKTGNLREGDTETRIVLIEQDLNTLTEEMKDNSFNPDDLSTFFKQVISEFDKIINLYYPLIEGDKK